MAVVEVELVDLIMQEQQQMVVELEEMVQHTVKQEQIILAVEVVDHQLFLIVLMVEMVALV